VTSRKKAKTLANKAKHCDELAALFASIDDGSAASSSHGGDSLSDVPSADPPAARTSQELFHDAMTWYQNNVGGPKSKAEKSSRKSETPANFFKRMAAGLELNEVTTDRSIKPRLCKAFAIVALRIFIILPASVEPESSWSQLGQLITAQRSALMGDIVNALGTKKEALSREGSTRAAWAANSQ